VVTAMSLLTLPPSAAAAAVGLVVTLDVPLLCTEQSLLLCHSAEQSLLLSLQHLPRALAVALAVAVVDSLLTVSLFAPVAVASSRKLVNLLTVVERKLAVNSTGWLSTMESQLAVVSRLR
jgi:hypothetical protein